MKHTIISWDCSYRNFFHLIDGLLYQDYPKKEFEIIYIEQRNKEFADKYNHKFNLKSLYDRYLEIKNKMNIQVIYLNDSLDLPYHLGKCNNAGIKKAKGEIISIMDGDQLLPNDFLKKIDKKFKDKKNSVLNLHRLMCEYPINVKEYKDWKNAHINYKSCLNACPNRFEPTPKSIQNCGPMISAKKEYWDMTNGYDENKLWSTGLSTAGSDVNTRLQIAAKSKSIYLENCVSVHPWHPKGIGTLRKNENTKKYYTLQNLLKNWSVNNNEPNWKKRQIYTNYIYNNNKSFIDNFSTNDLNQKMENVFPEKNLHSTKLKCEKIKYKSLIICTIKKLLNKI